MVNFRITEQYSFETTDVANHEEHKPRRVAYHNTLSFRPRAFYNSIEEEHDAMLRYTSSNAWPTWFGDFEFYDDCRDIYNHITNEQALREIGMRIYSKRENTDDLRAVFYFMTNMSPLSIMAFTIAYTRPMLSSAWNGIGNWRC